MRRWLTVAVAVAAVAPRAARANGALEELAAGAAPATATAPGSRWISDKLSGIWDLDASWQLRLDLSSTRVYSDTTDATRGDVYLGSLSAAYAADAHWSLRLTGGWSPASTTHATVPVDAQGLFDDAMQADAQLRAAASSLMFGAGLDYDSATPDMHTLSASLSVSATYFTAQQELTGVQDPSGASGAPLLRDAFTPSVAHRWTSIAASVSLSYADYADGREFDLGASLRVQYKLALSGSRRLKLYAKLAAGTHADANYELTRSGSAGLGAQYTW